VVADLLRAAAPDEEVGALTRRRAELVSGRALAAWARRLDLPEALRLGRGEDQSGGRTRESVLATALEAVVGALYLDTGLDPVRALVRGQAFHS
jgi:ribonuclease-3